MATLIAFDSSTKSTGVAIFKDDKYVRSGVIKIKGGRADDRLPEMIEKIYLTIDIVKPTEIVFEDVRIMSNVHTTVSLSELLGAIIGKCVDLGIEYKQIDPAQWRQVHKIQENGLKRKELKELQVNKVKDLLGKTVTNDESDAILIGMAYLKIKENQE